MAKIAHTHTSPRNAQTTRDPHYANSTKNLAQFQLQLETKATTKPKIVVIASKVAEQYHLARRGRVTCEEALRGLLTIAYGGPVDALVGCLRRGMQSRGAMGWDGCNGRTPRGEYRKVVVMHEGSSAISRRPPEMRKHRLVVDVQDQLPTKAVSETLRARAYGRCQQLTYKLHAHLGLRSSAFLQGACLLLLLQPATPATTTHRRGAHPEPTSPERESACAASLEMPRRK